MYTALKILTTVLKPGILEYNEKKNLTIFAVTC